MHFVWRLAQFSFELDLSQSTGRRTDPCAREIAAFAWHHPLEMLEFPFRLYSTFGPEMLTAAMHHINREGNTELTLGHVDYREPFPPLTDACQLPANFLANTDSDSVRELVRRYTSPETHVMVYLAPIPSCTNSSRLLTRSFVSVGAAEPKVLPARSFAGDPYFAHVLPGSVPVSSTLLADALKTRLSH